jgi:hypothetical protein
VSILKPENSLVAGMAVVGLVIANYNLHNGSVAGAAASDAWDTRLVSSNQKAGWTSLVAVSGIALIAKDANIFILGCAAIIAMHSSALHAIAVHPQTGQLQAPNPATAYEPASDQLSSVAAPVAA